MPLPLLSYLPPMRILSAHADALLCRRTILRRGVFSLAMKSLNSTAVLFQSHKLLFLLGQGSQPKSKPRHEQTKFRGSSKVCNDHPYNPSCAVEGTMDMASCSVFFGLLLTSRRITYPSWSEQYLLNVNCILWIIYAELDTVYIQLYIRIFQYFICCGHVHCIHYVRCASCAGRHVISVYVYLSTCILVFAWYLYIWCFVLICVYVWPWYVLVYLCIFGNIFWFNIYWFNIYLLRINSVS